MKHVLRELLLHATIILGAMFLVLLVLNEYNPHMGFISSDISRWWLLAFCLTALINGVVSVVERRREK